MKSKALSLATKLYVFVGLFLLSVLALSAMSVISASRMGQSGEELHASFVSVDKLTVFRLMIERHRRIVESAPAELDRQKLQKMRGELIELSEQIENVAILGQSLNASADSAAASSGLPAQVREMLKHGHGVIGLAERFAHDRAAELAQGPYDKVSDAIQAALEREQDQRSLRANESVAAITAVARASEIAATIAAAAALLLLAPLGALMASRSLKRLNLVRTAMLSVANGNRDIEIPCRSDRDEVGAMASALVIFKDNLQRIEHFNDEQQKLKDKAAQARRDELDSIAASFEANVQRFVETVADSANTMGVASDMMADVAANTNRRTGDVMDQVHDTTLQVAAVAGATHQLTMSISHISNSANGAAEIAREVGRDGEVLHERVSTLAASVREIDQVAETIGTIAAQTNLLALNATIEAARAGEAGRGFAVVASEVKSLAGQTAQATQSIAAQIQAVQQATIAAVEFIDRFAGRVQTISHSATTIAETVDEQRQSIDEINKATNSIAHSAEGLKAAIGSVREDSERNSSAAQGSQKSADELGQNAEKLQQSVALFLEKIRVA
jgi:methyl-accepting chemotaxis protein